MGRLGRSRVKWLGIRVKPDHRVVPDQLIMRVETLTSKVTTVVTERSIDSLVLGLGTGIFEFKRGRLAHGKSVQSVTGLQHRVFGTQLPPPGAPEA